MRRWGGAVSGKPAGMERKRKEKQNQKIDGELREQCVATDAPTEPEPVLQGLKDSVPAAA